VWMCTGFIWLQVGTVMGCCERGNEHSGSIKGVEYLGQLSFPRRNLLHAVIESRPT
jgi:hypothetical protein